MSVPISYDTCEWECWQDVKKLIDSAGLHRFVLGLNAKFSGFSCDLAKRVGINTIPGQVLAQVSEHTFEIAFDAINPGNCS